MFLTKSPMILTVMAAFCFQEDVLLQEYQGCISYLLHCHFCPLTFSAGLSDSYNVKRRWSITFNSKKKKTTL